MSDLTSEAAKKHTQKPYGYLDGLRGMLYEPRHMDRLNNPKPLYENPVAGWISVLDEIPTERCIAFTPNEDPVIRHRFVPAGMFKRVATDATHWMPIPADPID